MCRWLVLAIAMAPLGGRGEEPAPRGRVDGEIGTLRRIEVHAPKPNARVVPEVAEPPSREIRSVALPPRRVPVADEDTERERVGRQIERYQKAIDSCTDAARRRRPSVQGELRLAFKILEKKVVHVDVTTDTTRDPLIAECIAKESRWWVLPAGGLVVPWRVEVGPTTLRTRPSGAGR